MSDGGWQRVDAGDGVLLRRVRAADAPGVLAVHGDPRVYALDPHETHRDLAHSRRFLEPMLRHWARHGFGYWAVLVPLDWWPDGVPGTRAEEAPDDGTRVHAGLGGLQHYLMAGEQVLNVYVRFAPATQGRGLARRVINTAVRMAPTVAPGLDLVVRTRPANAATRRVAERAGFVDEGLEPGTTDMALLRLSAPVVDPAG
ncbi:acetyltransferase [Beutenbergia cavernae DSM 12333]|uniref:Acetyltransferase n=1 Tax=Beutenbergia cavernae (strain ATCC BAA-8 / DSM 12333 / CCUG 43141 / JCM 11478 / NBRC 16432 / NCIMB 13614 / HKI 0122) TaxID=471853 RepID=C5C038_BEUC1|nr:GNAT family N-acetyltransferase [Beutenbergia cavernae]ACQ79224.1 acetyltransferase [Beutenbergia cavernae DSM 12333]